MRRSSFLFLAASALLLAAALPLVAASDDLDVSFNTPGGYRATFSGDSGKMKLYPLGEGASKFIEIKWDKIEELDVDGKEVQKVGNFASQAFIIRGPDEVIYDAGSFGKFNATRIILDATVTPSKSTTEAKFKVSIWAFKTDVTLPNGASTVTVPRDNLKFSVDVEQWDFKSPSNSLTFGAEVKTPGLSSGTKKADDKNGEDVYEFEQNANVVVQNSAVIDGTTTVAVNSTLYTKDAKKSFVQWTFPSFTSTLNYDPNFGFGTTSGAIGSASTGAAAIVLAVLAVCGLLAQ